MLIPKENLRDLAEIDPVVRESLRFVSAETVDTVLSEALYPAEAAGERPEPVQEPIITAVVPVEKAGQDAPLRQ